MTASLLSSLQIAADLCTVFVTLQTLPHVAKSAHNHAQALKRRKFLSYRGGRGNG